MNQVINQHLSYEQKVEGNWFSLPHKSNKKYYKKKKTKTVEQSNVREGKPVDWASIAGRICEKVGFESRM